MTKGADHENDWNLLLSEIFKERNIDFSQYHEKLLVRRVAVRLRATRSALYGDYLAHLRGNREEMDALLDALTINTTQFFRDRKVFEALRVKVLPQIFTRERLAQKGIARVWSAGCSGGEEAMSILMVMAETLSQGFDEARIHIYGTDIDHWAIEKAQSGVYDEFEFKEMPPGLRAKYFLDMRNGRFWRRKEWNRFLSFRQRDLVKEKPLGAMDIVFCRNTFIYFKRELQILCLEKFAQALKSGGFLVLGLTESLWEGMRGTFQEFDRENRIYRKVA